MSVTGAGGRSVLPPLLPGWGRDCPCSPTQAIALVTQKAGLLKEKEEPIQTAAGVSLKVNSSSVSDGFDTRLSCDTESGVHCGPPLAGRDGRSTDGVRS